MVSGSLSLPSSGCFPPFPHGTCPLSVSRECLALPDGPGGFAQGSTCPALLRVPLRAGGLRAWGYHPLRPGFPARHARLPGCDSAALQPRGRVATPAVWASPRSLATTGHYWGNHCCFLFLRVLRCFSSPGSPRATKARSRPCWAGGCPIRTPAGQWPVAPHRSFSQLPASFVASSSQGIRHAPLFTSTRPTQGAAAPAACAARRCILDVSRPLVLLQSCVPVCQRSYRPKGERGE